MADMTRERALELVSRALSAYTQGGGAVELDEITTVINVIKRGVTSVMTQGEWLRRRERWRREQLSADRQRGRIEGQLMTVELYLLRLTEMGLSRERIIEMLNDDMIGYDQLTAYAAQRSGEASQSPVTAGELFTPSSRHKITLQQLITAVRSRGGALSSIITLEADGEPVYIHLNG